MSATAIEPTGDELVEVAAPPVAPVAPGWSPRDALAAARRLLPAGRAISEQSFVARHRVVRWALASAATLDLLSGAISGAPWLHLILDLLPALVPGAIAWRSTNREVAGIAGSFALMAAVTAFVHQTGGATEAHFLYFVALPLVAVYQSWRAFLAAIGYVLFSHAIVGIVAPEAIYDNPASIAHPVRWAIVHSLFVVALVVVMMIEWRFAEADQQQTQTALHDLRAAQSQLVQAEKLESIGQLAAGVAHEINTPVQYLTDNSTFLSEAFRDLLGALDRLESIARRADANEVDDCVEDADLAFLREEIPKALEQSHEGLGRVSEIVRAMKDFSHPGSDLAASDLNRAIASTVTVSRNEWKYVARVDLALDPTLPMVRCHEGQIKQVVLNLIVNAAHAIGEQSRPADAGVITVRTDSLGERARIRVSDNGCGMPPHVQARIFDPFFTTKGVGRGTGQGLSVVHRVVKAHDGLIRVDSTPGHGTTFTIELPFSGPDESRDDRESGATW